MSREANSLDRKIGAKVRERRRDIGMSQEKLAELLGVTFQQVQKYEKGKNRIAASRLWDIARALLLPVARFFPSDEATMPAAPARVRAKRIVKPSR